MMNNFIGADAAKLAGLQIDLLQKVRLGHITLDQLLWFVSLRKNERASIVAQYREGLDCVKSTKTKKKFSQIADLGVIVVPDDYEHANRLALFSAKIDDMNCLFDEDITDMNYGNPSRILHSGDKLRVRVFGQDVSDLIPTKECLEFLKTQGAVHTGAQGLALIFDQVRDKLPIGKRCASLDEKEHLRTDSSGVHLFPYVCHRTDHSFSFKTDTYEQSSIENVFFCVTEVS